MGAEDQCVDGVCKGQLRREGGLEMDSSKPGTGRSWGAPVHLVVSGLLLRLGSRGRGGVPQQQAGVLMHAWLLPSGSGKTGSRALLQDESGDCNGRGTFVGGICNCEMGWDPAANCSVPELCTDFGGACLQSLNPSIYPEPRRVALI